MRPELTSREQQATGKIGSAMGATSFACEPPTGNRRKTRIFTGSVGRLKTAAATGEGRESRLAVTLIFATDFNRPKVIESGSPHLLD